MSPQTLLNDGSPHALNLLSLPRTKLTISALEPLSRVGVVDIGSNSVRFIVFDGAARSPAYFFNEKIMCALGRNLGSTGHLNPEGRERAVQALIRFKQLAQRMGVSSMTLVATAAVRDASDGAEFCHEVHKMTGLKVEIIDGREEARLAAQGVLLGWPGSYGLVCDMGGSSMELAEIADGEVGRRLTSDLGPLKLQSLKGGKAKRRKFINETLDRLRGEIGEQRDRLFLVGGSWRAIARIDMHRRGYPLHVLHEYRMTRRDIRETAAFIASHSDHEALRSDCGISSARMALVPLAAQVLKRLVRRFKPHDIAISSYGLREGLLYERMPFELRARDPLIESCRFAESKDARLPGYGDRLFDFISPLFEKTSAERKRLIRAACLLHDVSWRGHPDYRSELCFDNATRANLGGLTHEERVYLGLALLHRYSNQRKGKVFEPLYDLISPKALKEAETLGKAMRFGALMWDDVGDEPCRLEWKAKTKRLTLYLSEASKPVFGEVAEGRLTSLATSLGAKVTIR